MGHTMSIHSQNEQVILEFGLKKPAFRIVVNTPTTHGSIGLTTGLDPAMTLGCGGYGGNITSDNISPRHLLNIKRLAYELHVRRREPRRRPRLRPASRPAAGISAEALASRLDAFLGVARLPRASHVVGVSLVLRAGGRPPVPASSTRRAQPAPADFVCEDDVAAGDLRAGRRLIVSASARSSRPRPAISAKAHRVFVTGAHGVRDERDFDVLTVQSDLSVDARRGC